MASLPAQLTSFIGRDEQIEQAVRLLKSSRLLTLTGPGGVGKTRLALEVAAAARDCFCDGVLFVSLASISDPDAVASTVVAAIGLHSVAEVSPDTQLVTFLRTRETLLVLDNFEHLLAASSLITDLLVECPGLRLLVTSRIALRLAVEQEAPVPPMALPNPGDAHSPATVAKSEAVALFTRRAQARRPAFLLTAENVDAVVGICRRLDGLPLAIELAAAHTGTLTPHELIDRLHHVLPLLVGGPRDLPARQQTIRDTIAWSYDLLSTTDQRFFRMLAILPGGWSLESAEAVSDPDANVLHGLTTLIDHNLVWRTEHADGSTRFSMLESIREFGLEQLRAFDEEDEVYRRYSSYLVATFSESERDWHTPQVADWLRRGDAENANVRQTLEWAMTSEPTTGLRLARAFAWYWFMRGAVPESQAWLVQCLASADTIPDDLRAHVLWQIGSNATTLGDFTYARAALDQAHALYSSLGDDVGVGTCLHSLGRIANFSGDMSRAVPLYRAAAEILRRHQVPRRMVTLSNLGHALVQNRELEQAVVVFDEALELAERHGNSWHVSQILGGQADLALARGDRQHAHRMLRRCIQLDTESGDPRFIAQTLETCAWLATTEGAAFHAARLLGIVAGIRDRIGVPVPPSTQRNYDCHVPMIKKQLGPIGWQRSWTDGYRLPLREAIDVAIRGLDDIPLSSPGPASQKHDLTEREVEVLRLIANGLSNKEIAARLRLSIRTVERHINNLYRKIDAQNKADATAFAIRHDLA